MIDFYKLFNIEKLKDHHLKELNWRFIDSGDIHNPCYWFKFKKDIIVKNKKKVYELLKINYNITIFEIETDLETEVSNHHIIYRGKINTKNKLKRIMNYLNIE